MQSNIVCGTRCKKLIQKFFWLKITLKQFENGFEMKIQLFSKQINVFL